MHEPMHNFAQANKCNPTLRMYARHTSPGRRHLSRHINERPVLRCITMAHAVSSCRPLLALQACLRLPQMSRLCRRRIF